VKNGSENHKDVVEDMIYHIKRSESSAELNFNISPSLCERLDDLRLSLLG